MESLSTREKIIDASVMLFSDKGYDKVSMRDIAAVIGIKAASIYHHFPSKRDILKALYSLYTREYRRESPSLESLLQRIETEPVRDILMNLDHFWPLAGRDQMERIILIASQRISLDRDSENFIQDHFFEPIKAIWIPLLNRAAETGKIEKVDAGIFAIVTSFFAFAAVGVNRTAMKLNPEQWRGGLSMILSILKAVPEPG